MPEKRHQDNLLYFYPSPSSFIARDLEILSQAFSVKSFSFEPGSKGMLLPWMVRQKLTLLGHIFSSKAVVCRFAGYHSLLPMLFARLTGKASLVIIGGTEAHYFPSVPYGTATKRIYRWFAAASMKLARHLAPVDGSLLEYDYTYDMQFPSRQGLRNLYPSVSTPATVIHNGYDAGLFRPDPAVPRQPKSFLTVANASRPFEFILKGLDLVLAVSKERPDCTFTIAGRPPGWLRQADYPNVEFTGPVPYEQLPALYSRHTYYLQLSVAEGFPNSLCEAMLCGCVPVVSKVFSMPDIVGDTGFVLKHRDAAELNRLLDKVLSASATPLSENARQRIAIRYPLERRKEELIGLVRRLIERH